jgi:hypothetical protein
LVLELLHHVPKLLCAVSVHLLRTLLQAEDQRILFFVLLFAEIGDGEGLRGEIETFELLDIEANVVMGQENRAILFV